MYIQWKQDVITEVRYKRARPYRYIKRGYFIKEIVSIDVRTSVF